MSIYASLEGDAQAASNTTELKRAL